MSVMSQVIKKNKNNNHYSKSKRLMIENNSVDNNFPKQRYKGLFESILKFWVWIE